MSQSIITEVTKDQLKADRNHFKVGDEVAVHTKVREGEKERIQIFSGIVISRKGSGVSESFTVRKIASGFGLERVFPVHSPNIEKVVVTKESVVLRSAKMYYLRNRVGKRATQVKENRFFAKKK